jgi:hypothetical protein
MSPSVSTATQSDTLGHETAVNLPDPAIRERVHADLPPVGPREVITCPSMSTATHSDLDGHDTADTGVCPEAG